MRFSEAPYIGFDTESTGLHWPVDRAFGFSLALPDGTTTYHDIRREPGMVDWFNDEMSRFGGIIICHNASFDYKMALSVGMFMPIRQLDDTAIRACLINEHEPSFSLDSLCEKYIDERKESEIYAELAEIFGGRATRGVQMKHIASERVPVELIAKYARKDALLALRLWEWQEQEIKKQALQDICAFERRVMVPIIEAEMRGIRVDLKAAEKAIDKLTVEIAEQQTRLNSLVGFDLNVNSPKQVKEVFRPAQDSTGDWYADNGYALNATESGNPSLDAAALRAMEDDQRAALILSVRSTIKTRDTFLAGHVLSHAVGDRVYPHINQNKSEDAGTGTGRLSYTEPALQQIPSRNKKVASIVKPVFLPDEDCEWMSLDMNSFEVRVFAHLVNNPVILGKYAENELADFHQMVADLTNLPRNATYSGQANAKQLNLSMIFNSGNGAIAEKMGMDWEWNSFQKEGKVFKYKKAGPNAELVIADYHSKLPGVKELAARAKATAESFGYVQTKMGRHLRFPRKFKTYKASGLAIQATAADINKQMWLLCADVLRPKAAHLIMNTHDSYELNVRRGTDPLRLKSELQEGIRAAVPWFRVPLVIDLNGVGANYWDSQNG